MAIIKCPECGHQISDKAPMCPNCGVEIAGKITKCPHCGDIYLKGEIICPHCHETTAQAMPTGTTSEPKPTLREGEFTENRPQSGKAETPRSARADSKEPSATNAQKPGDGGGKKKKNTATLLVSILISLIVVGACFYKYYTAQQAKEIEEYEFAMKSDDPLILQTYLSNFKSASKEHVDAINARLRMLTERDKEWADAMVSGSKSALNDYLEKYPDTPHKQEIIDRIDSIDWAQSLRLNTVEAYQAYLKEHSDGDHYDEAQMAVKKLKASEVTIEETETIGKIFRQFFLSINTKDEDGLTANIAGFISFLDKPEATRSDVVSFMQRQYKADVNSVTWSLNRDYKIQKKEIGDSSYEYGVSFTAIQKVDKTDNSSVSTKFRIDAKINPEWKITEFAMTRINE